MNKTTNDKSLKIIQQDFESKLSTFFTEDKVQLVQELAGKYLPVDINTNGNQFWENYILSSTKDYTTDAMRGYQVLRELKGRLSNLSSQVTEFRKLEIEITKLQRRLERENFDKEDGDLDKELIEIELQQKRVKLEFDRQSVNELMIDIEDFKKLADKYCAEGLPAYRDARNVDMHKKIVNRYVQHLLYGDEMSPAEKAFFMKDGLLVPPTEVLDSLKALPPSAAVNNAINIAQNQIAMDAGRKPLGLEAPKTATLLKMDTSILDGIKIVTAEEVLSEKK